MRRRTFLLSGLAAVTCEGLGLGLALPRAASAATNESAKLIDAHCHIFNAADVPVENFLKRVVLRKTIDDLKKTNAGYAKFFENYRESANVMLHMLGSAVSKKAPGPNDEISLLEQMERGAHAPDPLTTEKREIAFLTQILQEVWQPYAVSRELRKVGGITVPRDALIELKFRLRKEASPGKSDRELRDMETSAGNNNNDYGYVAKQLYRNSDEVFGHYIRWALRFIRYRFQLADELSALHGGRAVLATPALVDFSMWLAPPEEAKKDGAAAMQNQVEVMARISRRKTGVRVHGFVGFDPLRQALHVKHGLPPSQSPLAVVQSAVETKGFIGVKLYPPMGFRPIGNAELKDAFPPYVLSGSTGLGKDAGKALDNALLSLFVWCRDNNVPIMAHARNSNDPYPRYGERAHPELWERLLQTKDAGGKDFSSLRINLAHFGGFEEAFEEENTREETWEWANGKLWKGFPHSPVFADVSYFNDVLPLAFKRNKNDPAIAAHAARVEKIKEFLADFRVKFPTSGKHLIFGTDWTMVGNAEGFPELGRTGSNRRYTDRVVGFLTDAGYRSDIDDILFNNAVRFLGLGLEGREHGTRGRLEKFYASAGLSADWLRQFD